MAIRKLKSGETIWDGELRGFGARRQADSVSYFLKCRFEGNQRWVTVGRHGNPWTLDGARKRALEILVDAKNGIDPRGGGEAPGGVTLREALKRYMREHGTKLKPRTAQLYQGLVDNVLVPEVGEERVAEIERATIETLHRKLKETPRKANTTIAVLSSFFGWAEDENLREEGKNPCKRIKRYKERKRERYLNADELTRLGKVLAEVEQEGSERPFAVAAIRLLILTGARLGEILGARWSYVDLARGELRLPDSKTGEKVIRLNEAACDVLNGIPRVVGNPYVIVGIIKGKPMVNLHIPWEKIRHNAGLDEVRLHDLRHSFASVAAESGASLPMIGTLLGHTRVETTARYAHLQEKPVRDLNEGVGKRLAVMLGGK